MPLISCYKLYSVVHTEAEDRHWISNSLKGCCSEADPLIVSQIPPLNGKNGRHKSTVHMVWEADPLLRALRGRGANKKKEISPETQDHFQLIHV